MLTLCPNQLIIPMNTIYAVFSILGIGAVVVIGIIGRTNHFRQIAAKCDPVLAQLAVKGDNHSLTRRVDHWIYFNSKPDMDKFVSEVDKTGFELLSEQVKEAGIYNYVVNIGRDENVIRQNIIHTVGKLQLIAKKHNGYYEGWGCPIVR